MAAVSVVEDAERRGAPAHQQPAAGRQQRHPAGRWPAGLAAAAAAPGAAAGAVPRAGHRASPRRRRRADPALQVDAVELLPEVIAASAHFTARAGRRGADPRLHLIAADARRYVRASERRYDVDRLGQLPSRAQRLGFAVHGGALPGRARAGWRRAGCSASGCRCTSWTCIPCAASCGRFWSCIQTAGRILASNSLETPVLGLVARADGGRFEPAAVAPAWPARPARRALAGLGLEDELAVLGSFVAGPRGPAPLRR